MKPTPESRTLATELGEFVKMKYAIPPKDWTDATKAYHGVPLDLIWRVVSQLSGKTVDQLADDGCDGHPLG